MSYIMADDFMVTICNALEVDPSTVGRMVIDCTAGQMVRVWLLVYGQENMLSIESPSRDIFIRMTHDNLDSPPPADRPDSG